jgi:hypothetical protein
MTWTRILSTCAALVAASLALVPPVTAQTPGGPTPADAACTYDRCALRLDGSRLVRGVHGELVAKPGWFRPMPLAELVSGSDSALHYARRYEEAAARASALSNGGGLAVLTALGIAWAHDRSRPDAWPYASSSNDRWAVATGVLMLGGFVAEYASIPFVRRADRARARALWWHNRQFAR